MLTILNSYKFRILDAIIFIICVTLYLITNNFAFIITLIILISLSVLIRVVLKNTHKN